MIIRNRLNPPRPRIARRFPADVFNRVPEIGRHNQTVELKRLFRVPVFGRMRGKRADDPAAGPCPHGAAFDHAHLGPASRAFKRHRQAKCPRPENRDVRHCQSILSGALSP